MDITGNSYNGMDKLTEVVTPGSTVNYGYDALGRRISRSEGSSITNYHHNANSDLTDYETDSSGALTSSFNRGADGLISETDYSGTPTTSYHLYNSHGDTSALSDQNGSVTGSYRYDSFGNPISGSPPENGYTGKWQREKDSSTGMIRMGVREYDPVLGRFVSEDLLMGNTTDPLQRNRYNFVKANPLNHYDITGYSMDFWNSMLNSSYQGEQTGNNNYNDDGNLYSEQERTRFGAGGNGYRACSASLTVQGENIDDVIQLLSANGDLNWGGFSIQATEDYVMHNSGDVRWYQISIPGGQTLLTTADNPYLKEYVETMRRMIIGGALMPLGVFVDIGAEASHVLMLPDKHGAEGETHIAGEAQALFFQMSDWQRNCEAVFRRN